MTTGLNLTGTAGPDELYGSAGDDRLEGGDGDDALTGGEGNDELLGGRGMLTQFSQSGENVSALSDLIAGGVNYQPYGA